MELQDKVVVTKRSGELADFDSTRIKNSIIKAFLAAGKNESEEIEKIVLAVEEEVRERFQDFIPNVENIQDIVEKNLMKYQMFDVAKAYILYRAERQKQKQEERKKKSFLKKMTVVKGDGRVVLFNYRKIADSVSRNCAGLKVSPDRILEEVIKNIYDGVKTVEIDRALVMAASSLIECDPDYGKAASRLYLQQLRKEVLDESIDIQDLDIHYRQAFINGIKEGVKHDLLDKRMLNYDLPLLSKAIKIDRDNLFEYMGIQTLYERYLLKTREKRLELPQCFWMRVAMGLAINEDNPNQRAVEFYEVLSTLRFVSSTPTLFHAGTPKPQLSSCYLLTVTDDLKDIFKYFGDHAQLSKWSGGIGTDWSHIRGTGSWISTTKVESQGVIPFLKIANDTTSAINRSGKRRGAACAYLETWHFDIEEFLDLRKNTGDERRRTHDLNTANWIPDLFMERVLEDGSWTLFSPDETPDLHDLYGSAFKKRYVEYEKMAQDGKIKKFKKIEANKLWRKMLTMLFETGHPWPTWKDPCNIRSPQDHVGVVHSSNLCTEITLNTSKAETAVCNIGSINLATHVRKNGTLDWDRLAVSVRLGIRMLDNVVDENYYPTDEARNSNLKHRPIGLGVMGYQDALYMMKIPFDSKEAVAFSDQMMEFISFNAILASSMLAKEKGAYSTYKGSKWDRGILPHDTIALLQKERGRKIQCDVKETLNWSEVREHIKQHGMRNSNTMAIAPTATISNITGCLPCIEPIYKNIYVKANISGEFTVVNKYLVEDLKKLKLWNEDMLQQIKFHDGSLSKIEGLSEETKNLYKEAFEIEPTWILQHAGVRGKWIDQSQSVNIFIRGASGKKLHDTYLEAWERGLKTTYYLRTLAASQVEKSTLDAKKFGFTQLRKDEPEVKACRLNDPTCESCQ